LTQRNGHDIGTSARPGPRPSQEPGKSRRSSFSSQARVTFDEAGTPATEKPADVLALEDALQRFAELDERKSRVVECRVFGGMTIEETAAALGVSTGTVITDYRAARGKALRTPGTAVYTLNRPFWR
jgi:DNA-directed RNA polymerase specialized sigma24 family protein